MRERALVALGLLLVMALAIGGVACGVEADSDGDGWTDAQERTAGTDAHSVDTDGDGYWDPEDPDPLDPGVPVPAPTPSPSPQPTSVVDHERQLYAGDERMVQLAVSAFHADVHGGFNAVAHTWCDADLAGTTVGHYLPTYLGSPADHTLVLNPGVVDAAGNPRVDDSADGLAVDDSDIGEHAVWVGLVVNRPGDFEAVPGGSARRGDVSPLIHEQGPYMSEIPQSSMAGDEWNGGPAPGGSYCWVMGADGVVFGAYRGEDGCWYSGFNGVYP